MFFGLILLFLQIQRSCHWWHLLAHTVKEALLWLLPLTEWCQVITVVVWVTYYCLHIIWLSRICDRFLLNASFLLHIFFLNNVSSNSQNITRLTLHMEPARLLCPWGFFRQEYWNGLPFPSPGGLTDPGIEPGSPALQADSLPLSHHLGLFKLAIFRPSRVGKACWTRV